MGAKRGIKTMFVRSMMAAAYCSLGAAIFYAIEHKDGYEEEIIRKKYLYNKTRSDIMQRFGINDTEYKLLVSRLRDAISKTPDNRWSFSRGIDLSLQAMTTIGYGSHTPATVDGQAFLIPFAFVGIPLTALMLKAIGENTCYLICYIITMIEKKVLKREEVRNLHFKAFIVINVIALGLISLMAATSTILDNWSFAQGLYVWFVTFTTIGFGDYIPGGEAADDKDSPDDIFLLYKVTSIIIGLSLLSTILNAMGDIVEKQKESAQPLKSSGACIQNCWLKHCSGEVHVNEIELKSETSVTN